MRAVPPRFKNPRRGVARALVCSAALLAGVLAPAIAAEAQAPASGKQTQREVAEKEKKDPLRKEIEWVGSMIGNAEMRLRTGVSGIRARKGDNTDRLTPGRECCQDNLTHIETSMAKLRTELQKTSSCFERQRDMRGIQSLQGLLQAMREFDESLRVFAEAKTKPETARMLTAARGVYFKLLDGSKELPTCEDPAR